MGFWDDDEIKRRNDEAAKKLKDSWGKFEGDLRRRGDDERAWYRFLDDVANDPQILETKTEIELDQYRVNAQSEINRLQSGLQTQQGLSDKLSSGISSRPGAGGLAAELLNIIGGGVSNSLQGHIEKNRRLLELIKAKDARDAKQSSPQSPVDEMEKEVREREALVQQKITMLEKLRDEQKAKNPAQAASIDKRFRKMIEEVMDGN